jgi:hypothetical protein
VRIVTQALASKSVLPINGTIAIVKRDCPTCDLVAPVVTRLQHLGQLDVIASQDDPAFPPTATVVDDRLLQRSWQLRVDTVPTIVRFVNGAEVGRIEGWNKEQWDAFFADAQIVSTHTDLPAWRPGCGSMINDPGMPEKLAARYDGEVLPPFGVVRCRRRMGADVFARLVRWTADCSAHPRTGHANAFGNQSRPTRHRCSRTARPGRVHR